MFKGWEKLPVQIKLKSNPCPDILPNALHEIETTSTQYYDCIYNGYSGKLHVSYNLGWKLFSSLQLHGYVFLKSSTNLSVCVMAKVVNSHWK